jgi:hypothetical protein
LVEQRFLRNLLAQDLAYHCPWPGAAPSRHSAIVPRRPLPSSRTAAGAVQKRAWAGTSQRIRCDQRAKLALALALWVRHGLRFQDVVSHRALKRVHPVGFRSLERLLIPSCPDRHGFTMKVAKYRPHDSYEAQCTAVASAASVSLHLSSRLQVRMVALSEKPLSRSPDYRHVRPPGGVQSG